MKLSEAIEIETIHNDHNPAFTDADREKAHQLLIQAGKRVIWHKDRHIKGYYQLLPGETEE